MLLDENYNFEKEESDDADFNDVKKIIESPAMENCSINSDLEMNKETYEEFNRPFALKINRDKYLSKSRPRTRSKYGTIMPRSKQEVFTETSKLKNYEILRNKRLFNHKRTFTHEELSHFKQRLSSIVESPKRQAKKRNTRALNKSQSIPKLRSSNTFL